MFLLLYCVEIRRIEFVVFHALPNPTIPDLPLPCHTQPGHVGLCHSLPRRMNFVVLAAPHPSLPMLALPRFYHSTPGPCLPCLTSPCLIVPLPALPRRAPPGHTEPDLGVPHRIMYDQVLPFQTMSQLAQPVLPHLVNSVVLALPQRARLATSDQSIAFHAF